MDPQSAQSNPPEVIVQQQVPIGTPPPQKRHLRRYFLLGLFLLTLLGGLLYILTRPQAPSKVTPTQIISPTPTPTSMPTPTPSSTSAALKMQFLPGKRYFSDSMGIITKNNPHQIIIVSVTRAEQVSDYISYTTINFFNGSSWDRETLTSSSTRSDVANNTIVRNWSSNLDIQGQGRKSASVNLSLRNNNMTISANNFSEEISLVSLPDYTKFVYQGTGKIIINNVEQEAYIAYTRAYSLNAASLAFFNNPASYASKWMTTWDNMGNFYVIDTLSSAVASNPYQNYQIGAVQTEEGAITRSSTLSFNKNKNDSGRFQVSVGKNSIDLAFLTSYNKASINEPYTWVLGPVDGTVQSSDDKTPYTLGILEYLEAKK